MTDTVAKSRQWWIMRNYDRKVRFGIYPKGQLRTERVQAQADEDVCWTMGSAKDSSRQRRAGQGDRPAEMTCHQHKRLCCTHGMKGTWYAWWAGMLPAICICQPPAGPTETVTKKVSWLPWNNGAASVHGAVRRSPCQPPSAVCWERSSHSFPTWLYCLWDKRKG